MTTTDRGWFIRTARRIGDLGNPFYDEERRRDVWNEASAVGLQVALWLGLTVSALGLWIGGAAMAPLALAVLAIVTIPSIVTVTYAQHLDVEVEEYQMSPSRLLPYAAMVLVVAGGLVRAALDTAPDGFLGASSPGRSWAARWG